MDGQPCAYHQACQDQPCTSQQLLLAAGYTQRTGNFKRAMDRLLAMGWVAYTVPDKPQSRLQKYKLTRTGRSGLTRHNTLNRQA